MGKRDKELNLGLPEELGRLVELESDSTGEHEQDVIRNALREYYRGRDPSDGLDERIATIEARLDNIEDEIEDHREAVSRLRDERDELLDELDDLKAQRDNAEDMVATMDDAIDVVAEKAEDRWEDDREVKIRDPDVERFADQFGLRKPEFVEEVLAARPELPRDAFEDTVVLDYDREYESYESAVGLIAEYAADEGSSARVCEMMSDVSEQYGRSTKTVRDDVEDVVGEDVFALDA